MNGSAMHEKRGPRSVLAMALTVSVLTPILFACEGAGPPEHTKTPGGPTVFSDGGLFGRSPSSQQVQGGGIGVNNFLWRAALDSLAFMPLASADPFGGVIVTDWHSLPEAPDERFKVNVFILGRELRADGLRAAVFRQRRDRAGGWADTAVDAATVTRLEDAILTRAREMRLAQR
jgi:hypothetical protein